MKFIIEKKDFEEALRMTGKVAATGVALFSRLHVGNGRLTVKSTTGHLVLACMQDVRTEDGGPMTEETDCYIDAKRLGAVVAELPEGSLTVSIGQVSANLDWNGGGCSFPVTHDEPFPDRLVLGEDPEQPIRHISVPTTALMKAFNKALPFLSEDDIRPVLGNVFFDVDGVGGVTAVGTDTQVLVTYSMTAENAGGGAFQFLIPKTSAMVLRNILDKEAESLTIHCDGTVAALQTGCYDMAMRCSDYRYPAYKTVMSNGGGAYTLTANRGEMLGAVRRIIALTGMKLPADAVVLEIPDHGDKMTMRAQNLTDLSAAREVVACSWNGPERKVAFRIQRLMGLLAGTDATTVSLMFDNPVRPVIFVPEEDGASRGMIMPTQVIEEVDPAKKNKKGAK